MLEVKDLHAGYGGSAVLHGVNLRVDDGEAVVMLGPNGHGKTTLLKVISGMIKPSQGSVTFNGRELTTLPPDEIVGLGVTHIPQGDMPFPQMTVLENLQMGAYRGNVWANRSQALERVFALFPKLAERRTQMAKSLSGGERRMLALGRGLMGKPQILLIDEPSLGLAPLITEQVYGLIGEIKATGVSILLIDESANHVSDLAQRVYVMGGGHVVREGPAATILGDEALLAAYLG